MVFSIIYSYFLPWTWEKLLPPLGHISSFPRAVKSPLSGVVVPHLPADAVGVMAGVGEVAPNMGAGDAADGVVEMANLTFPPRLKLTARPTCYNIFTKTEKDKVY